MNKDNKNKTNNNVFVLSKLKQVQTSFKRNYSLLENNGEKTEFHKYVNTDFVPPLSLVTIRAYCSDMSRIPDAKQLFITLVIAGKLVSFLQMKRDKIKEMYQASINDLQVNLKNFSNEKK